VTAPSRIGADVERYEPSSAGSMAVVTGGHLQAFQDWAKVVAVAGAIPDALRGKPADVFVTVMHGLDLGLRPMQALNLVYVVKGRPSLSAEGMRSLILEAGHELEVDADDKKATVRARRKGTDRWVEASFTVEQAKKAKLSGQNWDAYTEDMLVARATVRLARRYFPDVTNGLAAVEELRDAEPGRERPSLAAVAADRGQPAPAAQSADDEAEQARLRDEVARLASEHQEPPTDVVDGEVLDEATLDAQDSGWPTVAVPGGER
jgi:hypothetical protein